MRVAFTSCSSQGKTSLVNELLKLPEFRDYKTFSSVQRTLAKGIKDFGTSELTTDFTQTCILGTMAYNLIEYPKQINDRSVICNFAYSKEAKGVKNHEWLEEQFESLLDYYDVIFYIPFELPITHDGFRSTCDNFHKNIDNHIQEYIERYKNKVNFVKISGSIEERLETILNYLDSLPKNPKDQQ